MPKYNLNISYIKKVQLIKVPMVMHKNPSEVSYIKKMQLIKKSISFNQTCLKIQFTIKYKI